MSKIKLEAPFRQFRGKICKHSDIIFKQMYGETFTSQICNPYTGEPSWFVVLVVLQMVRLCKGCRFVK